MTDDQQQLADDCEAREDRLTDWERGFIDSIQRQLRPLSEKQDATLNAIWDRVTQKG